MKHCKTIDTATIARLLSHEDEHGMGHVFMYAFLNEVVRQKRPFPFDCESAQVSPNLMIVDNQGRSIAVEYKRNRLNLTLNDQQTEALSHIEYTGKAYRQVILAWLSACIWYTSLQPELRNELTQYAKSILRGFWWMKFCLCNNSAQSFPIFALSKRNIMSKNQINKYVWLVETLYKAKKITLKEINRRWLETDLSEGLEIPRRTFHSWKNEVEEMFGLVIMCDKHDGDRYYIENREVLEDDGLQYWLLNTLSVNNTLMENKTLSDRILLENIPSGQDFLATVLQAMKRSKVLQVTYKGYWSEHEHTFPVAPYCVKLFHQRWYMVGNSVNENMIRVYSLDRVLEIQPTEKAFKYPASFSPEVYFEGYFGVIHDEHYAMENVKLKVRADQANYLRSLPMHHSQTETERNADFSIFTLQLRPTYDFQQELLRVGDTLEVLEPLWLRNSIAGMIKRMYNNYLLIHN